MTLNEIVAKLGNSDYRTLDENEAIIMLKNSQEFRELKQISQKQEKVCEWTVGTSSADFRYKNYFRTRKEAIEMLKQIKQLLKEMN